MKHIASHFNMSLDWLAAESVGKDTKSFRNDNAESEKNYTSVNIPFVSS
jgi:hypothetical protein